MRARSVPRSAPSTMPPTATSSRWVSAIRCCACATRCAPGTASACWPTARCTPPTCARWSFWASARHSPAARSSSPRRCRCPSSCSTRCGSAAAAIACTSRRWRSTASTGASTSTPPLSRMRAGSNARAAPHPITGSISMISGRLPMCSRRARVQRAAALGCALSLAACAAQAFELGDLAVARQRVAASAARFHEIRHIATLAYRRPDHLAMSVVTPQPEELVIDGNTLRVSTPKGERTVALDSEPVLLAWTESLRATLAGDVPALSKYFVPTLSGDAGQRRAQALGPRQQHGLAVERHCALALRRGHAQRVAVDHQLLGLRRDDAHRKVIGAPVGQRAAALDGSGQRRNVADLVEARRAGRSHRAQRHAVL